MSKSHTPTAATLLFVLIGVLTAAIYLPGLAGDYVFDDLPNLLHNKRLQIDSLHMESLQGAAFSSGAGILRRPVSMVSFALNRYFFGVAPYSYKVVNLVIHLLTGLGLFLFSRLLVRTYRLYHKPDLPEAAVAWLPVVVSGLWLVHPLNLTSVLYIVQRMTSLATLFMVCGLCLYVAGRHRMLDNQRGLPLILTGLLVFGGLATLQQGERGPAAAVYAGRGNDTVPLQEQQGTIRQNGDCLLPCDRGGHRPACFCCIWRCIPPRFLAVTTAGTLP